MQVYILYMCGIELDDVELILINPEYVRQDELDVFGLFQRVSVAKDIMPLIPNVRSHIETNLDDEEQNEHPNEHPLDNGSERRQRYAAAREAGCDVKTASGANLTLGARA